MASNAKVIQEAAEIVGIRFAPGASASDEPDVFSCRCLDWLAKNRGSYAAIGLSWDGRDREWLVHRTEVWTTYKVATHKLRHVALALAVIAVSKAKEKV